MQDEKEKENEKKAHEAELKESSALKQDKRELIIQKTSMCSIALHTKTRDLFFLMKFCYLSKNLLLHVHLTVFAMQNTWSISELQESRETRLSSRHHATETWLKLVRRRNERQILNLYVIFEETRSSKDHQDLGRC